MIGSGGGLHGPKNAAGEGPDRLDCGWRDRDSLDRALLTHRDREAER